MSFYEHNIVPYLIEVGCGMKALEPKRQDAARGLEGDVLEIGFGSGLNLPHMPKQVRKVLAVDPSSVARRIGKKRLANAPCEVQPVGLDAQRIALPDHCADNALSTFTLCTIPDARGALQEVKRILKPGGRLHFLEHGRAPDDSVVRWQERLNGLQRAMCGGCNINRDMRALLESAGFRIEQLKTSYFPGMPKTHAYLYEGIAVPT